MTQTDYFMEHEKEALRLDLKTDQAAVRAQAEWAGIRPGMRVADLGCGAGKTAFILGGLTEPGGAVVGIDISPRRIAYARANYGARGIEFHERDIREPLTDIGQFDFIWVRFVLEYFRTQACEIIGNAYRSLRPGGTICLIDLDYNCLSHYGLSDELEDSLKKVVSYLQQHFDFDPYMGRKLYAHLYDLGCEGIEVDLSAHHLLYGRLEDNDLLNWTCKLQAAGRLFESEAAYVKFHSEFISFFTHPRRFTYTPLIMCKGKKPASSKKTIALPPQQTSRC